MSLQDKLLTNMEKKDVGDVRRPLLIENEVGTRIGVCDCILFGVSVALEIATLTRLNSNDM